jgi:CheY-like chemotaxis protein
LFVDDEPLLRKLGKRVLENSGYSVLLAKNGQEAVKIFQLNCNEIATVLLDITMPVMGGREALRLIREIRPDVPVIIMTGFDEDRTREDLGASARAFYQEAIFGRYVSRNGSSEPRETATHPRCLAESSGIFPATCYGDLLERAAVAV